VTELERLHGEDILPHPMSCDRPETLISPPRNRELPILCPIEIFKPDATDRPCPTNILQWTERLSPPKIAPMLVKLCPPCMQPTVLNPFPIFTKSSALVRPLTTNDFEIVVLLPIEESPYILIAEPHATSPLTVRPLPHEDRPDDDRARPFPVCPIPTMIPSCTDRERTDCIISKQLKLDPQMTDDLIVVYPVRVVLL
jgi:hypothetical protein